jgi:ketosteroid isomerase-like protein
MSRANIEMLRAGYEAFNRGERETVFEAASADFELVTADRVTNPGTYRGPEEALRFFEDLFAPFEEVVSEPEEFFENGDLIVTLVVVRSRPRGSTAVVENRIAHLWTVRGGKVDRLQVFPERRRAMEAAGLDHVTPKTGL